MIKHLHIWGVLCLIFVISNATPCVFAQKGSVIVIQTKGVVEAYSPQGRKLTAPVVRGSVLPIGYSIKTGLFAESTLLLSNGTTATLQENSKLRLDIFEQSPFDAKAGSFAQLQAEPSTSQVSIDMEIGSLVVQTKKLNKASSFSISTPVGTAGIRGTQFQMAMSPNTGMKLDVAESQVAFTPVGQNQPLVVGPGKGLDASATGVLSQRTIAPSAAQNINVKNSFATSMSGSIPVATAKQAIATASSSNNNSENTNDENADSEESEVPEGVNSVLKTAESFLNNSSRINPLVSGHETSEAYLKKILDITSSSNESPNDTEGNTGSGDEDETDSGDGGDTDSGDGDSTDSGNNNDQEDVFLQLSDADELILTISGKDFLLNNKTFNDIEDILSEYLPDDGYPSAKAGAFALYSLLEVITDLPNESVNDLFVRAWNISSVFISNIKINNEITIKKTTLEGVANGTSDSFSAINAKDLINAYGSDHYLQNLASNLLDYGFIGPSENSVPVDKILTYFKAAESGINLPNFFNLGTVDSYVLNGDLLESDHEYFLDPKDTTHNKSIDQNFKIYTSNIYGVVGGDISIGNSESGETIKINVGDILTKAENFENDDVPENDKKILAIAAAQDLVILNDVVFENANHSEDHALVLGAADHLEVYGDITYEGSNLGLGSFSSLELKNIKIETAGNLAIGSMSELNLDTVELKIGLKSDRDNIYLFAEETLVADDIQFTGRTREIYMEANTLNLSNIDFPKNSEVMLRSLNGEYHFYSPGEGILQGRVNFLTNSNTYNKSVINNSTFGSARTDSQGNHNGFDSVGSAFTTDNGLPGVKIRPYPNK